MSSPEASAFGSSSYLSDIAAFGASGEKLWFHGNLTNNNCDLMGFNLAK